MSCSFHIIRLPHPFTSNLTKKEEKTVQWTASFSNRWERVSSMVFLNHTFFTLAHPVCFVLFSRHLFKETTVTAALNSNFTSNPDRVEATWGHEEKILSTKVLELWDSVVTFLQKVKKVCFSAPPWPTPGPRRPFFYTMETFNFPFLLH